MHELVQIAGYRFFEQQQWVRMVYGVALLASGAVLAVVAGKLDKQLRSLPLLRSSAQA